MLRSFGRPAIEFEGEAPTNYILDRCFGSVGRPAIEFVPDYFVRDGEADHGRRKLPLFLLVPPLFLVNQCTFMRRVYPKLIFLCSALLFVAYLRVYPVD